MEQLPSRAKGYSLDFDLTELLHEDGWQEGMQVGYTRSGLKPCLHPLLAVLEEAKGNIIAFTLRGRLVWADRGLCQADWFNLLEACHLPYIVVTKLNVKIQSPLSRGTV